MDRIIHPASFDDCFSETEIGIDAYSYSVNEYTRRQESLAILGFSSYRAYLRSPLWNEIRSTKLKKDPYCYGCRRSAQQVHHGNYGISVLSGDTGKDLWSVCKNCHKWIEFTKEGYKRQPDEATAELRRLHRIYYGGNRQHGIRQRRIKHHSVNRAYSALELATYRYRPR